MTIFAWNALLAMAPAPNQQGQYPWWGTMVPFLLLIFIFYFMLIRPQQKKAREHDTLIKSIRAGDKVLTNGGIIGTVVSVKEKSLSLRSADAKLEVLKSAITEITERESTSAES